MSSRFTSDDHHYMQMALRLAGRGRGRVNPGPLVGAVIVKGGRIIGKGYYHQDGGAHAEAHALRSARGSARGATMYVTLEPHCFQGRTPPCTQAIIAAGVKRVVCALRDPNPLVKGRGLALLRQAGLIVREGLMKREAARQNEAFLMFHTAKRPFVAIKFATSLDGKIAARTGDSKWITNVQARNFTRALRGQYQAILVGKNTVLRDNPHLGARLKGGRDPLRIILDSHLTISPMSQVFRDANALVVTCDSAPSSRKKLFAKKSINVLALPGKTIFIPRLLRELYKQKIVSVLVEGGSEVLGSFLDARLVDKAYVAVAPLLIGGRQALTAVGGRGVATVKQALRLQEIKQEQFGDNFIISGYLF